MSTINSLWGELEADDIQEEKTPEELAAEEKPETDETEETEETTEEETEETEKTEEPEKSEETEKVDDDPVLDTLSSVTDALEDEELVFLDDEKEYEPTADGFAEMMKDNLAGQKAKLEADFEAREAAIRKEYEQATTPKFSELDPSKEDDAENMLREHYKSLELTQEEIDEKILELKDLEKLEKEAGIAQRLLVKKEQKAEEAAEAKRVADEAAAAKQREEFVEGIKSDIDNTDAIGDFQLDAKTKKKFKDFLFKPGKDGKTEASRALSPEQRLKVAFYNYMVVNEEDFKKAATTKVTKESKKKNSRFTSRQLNTKGADVEAPEEKIETVNTIPKGSMFDISYDED